MLFLFFLFCFPALIRAFRTFPSFASQELGIVPEGEWEDFMAALRRELPVTFRLSAIQGCRDPLHAQLVGDCFGLARPAGQKVRITCPERGGVISDYELAPPEPLSWYPDGNGWYFASSRRVVRKSPELLAFHNFLVRNDGDGQVVRQEAVSMIPPLFLQVRPPAAACLSPLPVIGTRARSGSRDFLRRDRVLMRELRVVSCCDGCVSSRIQLISYFVFPQFAICCCPGRGFVSD